MSTWESCQILGAGGEVPPFEPVGGAPAGEPVKGYVTLRYLIDSNGNLFSPEVVASEPPGVLDLIALSGLAKTRYRVSEQNPQAIPAASGGSLRD
jgi:hypothetical protein